MELERVATDRIEDGKITGPAVRHIVKVLRLRPGTEFFAYDGVCENRLRLLETGRESVRVETLATSELAPAADITVAQCIIKGRGWDTFLEKMCELGAARILPVVSSRTVARPEEGAESPQLVRWNREVHAAAAQCAGCAPEILPPSSFAAALDFLSPVKNKFVLCFAPGAQSLGGALPGNDSGGIALLLGPEGDLSPEEVERAIAAGFKPAHIGPRILRSETAAITATALALQSCGALASRPEYNF